MRNNTYLLDTNVLSEMFRSRPAAAVADWFLRTPPHLLFVSVISLGEINYGMHRLLQSQRRTALDAWINTRVLIDYAGRILPFEARTAVIWGELMRKSELAQRSRHAVDMQLAATAVEHGHVIVTRNTRHFVPLGLDLVNPWVQRTESSPTGSEQDT